MICPVGQPWGGRPAPGAFTCAGRVLWSVCPSHSGKGAEEEVGSQGCQEGAGWLCISHTATEVGRGPQEEQGAGESFKGQEPASRERGPRTHRARDTAGQSPARGPASVSRAAPAHRGAPSPPPFPFAAGSPGKVRSRPIPPAAVAPARQGGSPARHTWGEDTKVLTRLPCC